MVVGGALQEFIASIAAKGLLGKAFEGNAPAYGVVYNFEILLLFLTLIVIGPLARHWRAADFKPSAKFGLGELPS
ncbi:MAG: MFS transporter, partial [Beijerinckiaceae bacterium]|nr:MFS transporter [Beijerinckiaceae bacterium]